MRKAVAAPLTSAVLPGPGLALRVCCRGCTGCPSVACAASEAVVACCSLASSACTDTNNMSVTCDVQLQFAACKAHMALPPAPAHLDVRQQLLSNSQQAQVSARLAKECQGKRGAIRQVPHWQHHARAATKRGDCRKCSAALSPPCTGGRCCIQAWCCRRHARHYHHSILLQQPSAHPVCPGAEQEVCWR